MAVLLDYAGFARSVFRDVRTELRKWMKGRSTLDFLPNKPQVSHVQGLVVFAVFMLLIAGMFSYQAGSIKVGAQPVSGESAGGKPVSYGAGWEEKTGAAGPITGNVAENSDAGTQKQNIVDKNFVQMTFTLKWTDEPDHDRLHQNQPDELGVEVVAPWGENRSLSAKNPIGGEGVVTVTFDVEQRKYDGINGTGDWNYTVFAMVCGDNTPKRVGLLMWLDNGNAYTLDIGWKYYVKAGKP